MKLLPRTCMHADLVSHTTRSHHEDRATLRCVPLSAAYLHLQSSEAR